MPFWVVICLIQTYTASHKKNQNLNTTSVPSFLYEFYGIRWYSYPCTYLLAYLLTYLLTPWCRVLLEKLTGLQLVKKFPSFHGTRRFITALTSVRHLSLSWASPIQSIYPHPTTWRSVLILSTHLCLGLPSGLFCLQSKHLVCACFLT